MGLPVIAIFDIGKTNKKFLLFDREFSTVYQENTTLDLIADEDGHPTENLSALTAWIFEVFDRAFENPDWDITRLNFSTYGASLVHLNINGEPVTPLYNYTKPYPPELEAQFYRTYGPEDNFGLSTGTSRSGMLNSGLQLYWLKYDKPKVFKNINTSLHLPQYLSYLFTGKMVSEYTSIGCHTGLWDFRKKGYHEWVSKENLSHLLPDVISTNTVYPVSYKGKKLEVGIGIHDSSAALLPYLQTIEEPFALLSTGTWSVAMNPFAEGALKNEDLHYNCINYMQPNGDAVKAGRLFLGNEFSLQVSHLAQHFGVSESKIRNIPFNLNCFEGIKKNRNLHFKWETLSASCPKITRWDFDSVEVAYHQLIYELCQLQVLHLNHVIGQTPIRNVYIDGGFTANMVFVEILRQLLQPLEVMLTDSAQGTALGAAVALSKDKLNKHFLQKHYHLK